MAWSGLLKLTELGVNMHNYRFRTNWRGKLILQRLNTYRDQWGGPDRLWEDATTQDLKDYYKQLYKTSCNCSSLREQFENECQ